VGIGGTPADAGGDPEDMLEAHGDVKPSLRGLLLFGKADHDRDSSLLGRAASEGQTGVVEFLLGRGNLDRFDRDVALFDAAREGQEKTVALLLDRGADIHAAEDEALRAAAAMGHLPVVQLLLARGADPSAGKGAALMLPSSAA
jgi:hypothetical protein